MKNKEGSAKMLNLSRILVIVLTPALAFSAPLAADARPQQAGAAAESKSSATPRHDLSGTWEPANGPSEGIQPDGVKAMPNDGKPAHQFPYTPYGLQAYKSHHALFGADENLPGFANDPRDKCEPLGFPRMDFYNLRETQILQNE